MPYAANGKAAPLGSLFLFERFLKRGGNVIFFCRKFAYVDKKQYFCTRNRKDVLITCSGKTDVATLGSDLEGIAGAKTHTASVRRIAGGLADFGLSAIRFFLFHNETDIYYFVGDSL